MKLLRSILTFFFIFYSSIILWAEPHGRGFDPHMPDLGLPDGSEVGIGLLIAVICLSIGFLMLKSEKEGAESSSTRGCFSLILIGIGFIALIPLIAWICSIAQVLIGIGIILFIIIVIIGLISSKK